MRARGDCWLWVVCSQRGNLHEVLSDWSLPSPCNDDLQVATAETWGSCRLDIGDLSGPTQFRNFSCIDILCIAISPFRLRSSS